MPSDTVSGRVAAALTNFPFLKMATEVTLDDYEQFLAGNAGPETHSRVSDALNDPRSDLSVYVQGIRDNQSSVLRNLLETDRKNEADQNPNDGASA